MIRKFVLAAGLSAAALGAAIPSMASAQYYGSSDNYYGQPRGSIELQVGNGGYDDDDDDSYDNGYSGYGYGNGYDRNEWRSHERWEHRRHDNQWRHHRDHDRRDHHDRDDDDD